MSPVARSTTSRALMHSGLASRATTEKLHAIDWRAQLADKLQARGSGQNLADMLGAKTDLPVKAALRRIVDHRIGVGDQKVATRCQGRGEPADEPPKICAIANVVEDLAADDQVETRRQLVVPHVELEERDVLLPGAALRRAFQRFGGDVGSEQLADPGEPAGL